MEKLIPQQKKDWVRGLLISCPFGKPLDDCPLEKFRKIPISERIKLVDSMEEKQIDQIIVHHQKCLRQREKIHS